MDEDAAQMLHSASLEKKEGTLKFCPFCGGKAHLEDMGWPHHVYCEKCGARVTSTKCGEDGEDEACEKWNRRACRQQDCTDDI